MDYNVILSKLSLSKFRNSFHLKEKDILYCKNKGYKIIEEHAHDYICKRLANPFKINDGKQTPISGHPVFIAQHATATCCRKCLEKWHHIPRNYILNQSEIIYIQNLIMTYITNEVLKKRT